MKRESISGTGNGINEKYIPDLIQSIKEYSKLLEKVAKEWEKRMKKEGSVFSGQYGAITNWHNPYKIDIPVSEMPKKLIDTYYVKAGFRYRDSVQIGIHLPTKVRCAYFGGGEGPTGGTVLVAEFSIYDIKTFSRDETFTTEFRAIVLKELLEQYEEKADKSYADKINKIKKAIKSNSMQIEALSHANTEYVDELTAVEEKLNTLRAI